MSEISIDTVGALPHAAASYGPSPTKRTRRTKTDMEAIKAGLYEILAEQHPATVRGTFYQAVSRGLVAKTEAQYKGTVGRLLTQMRRDHELPYGWLADNTRWMRKPKTYSSLQSWLDSSIRTYRRALWDSQDDYVEIWLEKDALTGVVYDVTAEWDVPLMVTRGYPSLTFLQSAAESMANEMKPVFIYYLGDHDPSGVDIPRFVEEQLNELEPGLDLTFVRLAVLPDQIEAMSLPTRPTKRSDSRSRSFEGESVEVDAIPAPILREMVSDAIVSHVDTSELDTLLRIEEAERETMRGFVSKMAGGGET